MSDSLHTHKPDAADQITAATNCSPFINMSMAVMGIPAVRLNGGASLIKLSEAPSADARLSSFRIEAMDCPTEQTLIQNKLGKLAGVQQLEFNLINRVLGVTHDLPDTAPIIDAIKSLGMQAEPLEQGVEAPAPVPGKSPGGRWRCPASARWLPK